MFDAISKKIFADEDGAASVIRRLLKENFGQYRNQYIIAFGFMLIAAAAGAGSAAIMKNVINEVFIDQNITMVYVISGAVFAIFFAKGAATYGQTVVLSRIGNSIVAKLQREMFEKVTRLGVRYFDHTTFGDLATRFSHNTGAARGVMDLVILAAGRDVMSVLGLVTVMVWQNPLLSLIALTIMPPAVYAVSKLVRRVKKIAKSQFVSQTMILSLVKEMALGIRVVKSFNYETNMHSAMESAVSDVEMQSNKIAKLTARTSPLMETLGGVAIALIILYGGYSVIALGQDPGAFFAFITALLLAYEPIKRLARLQVNLNTKLVGVRLMYELLDMEEAHPDSASKPKINVKSGLVEFKDVEFDYGETKALNGLSFTAKAGEVTALVGASGAGKSTVFSLIERFYEFNSGKIQIDGQDIRDVSTKSLRDNIAIVTQDTFLFDRTIKENILIGRPHATDEEVVEAAKNANAHEFISKMDKGYDNKAGEGGARLSGGQRQRLAIARAMLSNAPILLLDEATSALDAESENKVQAALARLMKGRTTLAIAHRLATVRNADTIHVLSHGKLLESGTHNQLYEMDGYYRHLCELQFTNSNEQS
ncbi:Lipid A export ATP-binding/permease protein MsbA [Pseudovibrio axinellae]|uniref:Lipid A export ATP-binding/permease protein MsbA n=1 Tax=Pseudovibrio axinellae TaxID=989403 RepID=A0A165ULU5_9HYPH|nr:ABC transporter ATP-binding protein [Pseudovibrio axinellae]KZL12529.1 Lipid A export ATP-binding/permease protein MsbA [Pseudovibrio axinellae]SEP68333.1 ATP-binding cassette, subfamily B [Pseudovibrio axinellae]